MPISQAVVLQDLTKHFQAPGGRTVVAVDTLNLEIDAGQLVTLLGPSGCGKTTTLRMVAGFETPTSGRILIGDRDITHLPPNARDAAMVFQSYALFPHMTVAENIGYGLRFRRVPAVEARKRVADVMEKMGLSQMGNRLPSQLSGGQQQRVALARALVVEPQVLLFDEPLSNLDAKLREQMRVEIRRMQQALGITAIYVTHDQAEAMSLSDRVVVMNDGRVMQVGTPEEIYARPANRFVADFIGKVNFLPGMLVRQGGEWAVALDGQTLPVGSEGLKAVGRPAEGMAVDLVVRPEELQLVPQGAGYIGGRVVHRTYLGSMVEYSVEILQGRRVTVMQYNPKAKEQFAPGAAVGLDFESGKVHLLRAEG